jgi:thioredoxin reductase
VTYDCIVVGGGPAGLSAALILGRCLRHVLVIDEGTPRNQRSHALNGYLTREGIAPVDFLRIARKELEKYRTVELRPGLVVDVAREAEGFTVRRSDGERLHCRKLLLATGVRDNIPAIEGLAELYGKSVHHCPYCDAWEWRGQPLAVYAKGSGGVGLALGLTVWSDDVVLCTDGPADIDHATRKRLTAAGVARREEKVIRLEGSDGCLERVIFDSGPSLPRRALFFCTGQHQRSDLAARLGCGFTEQGVVATGKCESTNVPGLFVCGDASKDAQFVIVATAEGAEAAVAINQSLADARLAAL